MVARPNVVFDGAFGAVEKAPTLGAAPRCSLSQSRRGHAYSNAATASTLKQEGCFTMTSGTCIFPCACTSFDTAVDGRRFTSCES